MKKILITATISIILMSCTTSKISVNTKQGQIAEVKITNSVTPKTDVKTDATANTEISIKPYNHDK